MVNTTRSLYQDVIYTYILAQKTVIVMWIYTYIYIYIYIYIYTYKPKQAVNTTRSLYQDVIDFTIDVSIRRFWCNYMYIYIYIYILTYIYQYIFVTNCHRDVGLYPYKYICIYIHTYIIKTSTRLVLYIETLRSLCSRGTNSGDHFHVLRTGTE